MHANPLLHNILRLVFQSDHQAVAAPKLNVVPYWRWKSRPRGGGCYPQAGRWTTSEQVYIPEATDAAAGPAPLFAAPAKKKQALPKTTAVKAAAAKKSAKKIYVKTNS
jgi:hypothetical protein